jgi:Helix-turn-helix domain
MTHGESKLALMDSHTSQNEKQQAINLPAVRWTLEQEGMSTAEKAVLVSFAEHADHRGYSWPSVDRIAFTWQLHRATVRGAIRALL